MELRGGRCVHREEVTRSEKLIHTKSRNKAISNKTDLQKLVRNNTNCTDNKKAISTERTVQSKSQEHLRKVKVVLKRLPVAKILCENKNNNNLVKQSSSRRQAKKVIGEKIEPLKEGRKETSSNSGDNTRISKNGKASNSLLLHDKKKNDNKHKCSTGPQTRSLRNIAHNTSLIEQIIDDENFERNTITTQQNVSTKVDEIAIKENDTKYNFKTQSKQNVSDNPKLIEQILREFDDLEQSPDVSPKKVIFRNKIIHSAQCVQNGNRKNAQTVKSKKSSKLSQNESIYEFLSQSEILSNSNVKAVDPAADVIKKLIEEGKVSVANKRKGTGRKLVGQKRSKKIVQKYARTVKKLENPESNNKKNVETMVGANMKTPIIKLNNCEITQKINETNYEDDTNFVDEPDLETYVNTQNGAFSNLARSVIIHEAKKQESFGAFKVQEQRRLLEAARKLVSTPINKSRVYPPSLSTTLNLSPVRMSSKQYEQSPGNASPWRANEVHLPSAFNFSCNSSKLPSYSSEHIIATPRKTFPKQNHMQATTSNENFACAESIPIVKCVDEVLREDGCQSSSSFNKNDSNEENIAPKHSSNKNCSQKQSTINRIRKRSPLKPLNIIEVINLPPWKDLDNNNINDSNLTNKEFSTTSTSHEENSLESLFGFTELLDECENVDDSNEECNSGQSVVKAKTTRESSNLKSKLKCLKKWRPNVEQLLKSKDGFSQNLFEVRKPRQRCINEMLSSTAINEVQSKLITNISKNAEEVPLFTDTQLESSFDNKKPCRTYARPIRKRKVRHNFIMFPASDESDQDEECNQKVQHNKRQRKDDNEIPELNSFVNDFNNMCDEVEEYNLIIEKDA